MPKPKKQSKPAQDATPVIETIAKAMIPAVLGVGALCAITLAAIYFMRPAKKRFGSEPGKASGSIQTAQSSANEPNPT